MALRIVELFGYSPLDASSQAAKAWQSFECPFISSKCTKQLRDGTISGVCTVRLANSGPVICCPNRLYAGNYEILLAIASSAFGAGVKLVSGTEPPTDQSGTRSVAVFGKRWRKELRLPQRVGRGAYFVDWILALLGNKGELEEFVAVEIQAIDTTGNYRAERQAYLEREEFNGYSEAGLNWENVSKRILPQLIYKGHVLRQEPLCKKGMFFVCPTPVYERILQRLGGEVRPYHFQPGALTLVWYDLGPELANGNCRAIVRGGEFTTTIDQIALAFTAPANLPPPGVYQRAIEAELSRKTT